MVRQAMIAALYAILTWIVPSLSYGPIQFRLSEVLTLLAFFNPEYVIGLTVGCAISNLFSTLGVIDVVVGTIASFLALTVMSKLKNIWIASLMPALFSILIGAEIVLVSPEPVSFIVITAQIMLSEFIIVTVLGVPLFKTLNKNSVFRTTILNFDSKE